MSSTTPLFRLAGTVAESITDGPGIRFVVFTQGCPHGCPGCHNQETHDFFGGTEISVDDIFKTIQRDPLLSGITISGGEPMCQAQAMAELASRAQSSGLEVAVYTGYTFEQLVAENDEGRTRLLSFADVLVDGLFVLAQRSLETKFRGSKNQRIIDVKKSLASGAAVLMDDGRWN